MRIKVSLLDVLNDPFELLGATMLRGENIKSMQAVIAKIQVNATKLLKQNYRSVTSLESERECEVSLARARQCRESWNVLSGTRAPGVPH